ncbi:hypothetical protein AMATHDRAFT_62166 [Amanita thiersii Skay4041]|uniref:Uncharacterized protein n=1 Tax=Amanita thiersii Skay4041 TaxID=703135 RepID=A0A2A9NNP9_9AGAR|nr:hypothetical protein AMATHDRAFT_62166 [Amanita thiersii Skay4041]
MGDGRYGVLNFWPVIKIRAREKNRICSTWPATESQMYDGGEGRIMQKHERGYSGMEAGSLNVFQRIL